MDKVKEIILQQLQYLINPESDLPHSVLLFGVTENMSKELYQIVKVEFDKIKSFLQRKRDKEFNERFDLEGRYVLDKYRNLRERYDSHPEKLHDIYNWESDAFSYEYNRIKSIPTKLSNRLNDFNLIELNVKEFYLARDRYFYLNETLDFTNLQRANYDEEFARHYVKTEEEKEYEILWEFTKERMFPKYAFAYNIDEPMRDPYKLGYLFEPFIKDTVNWSVICFEPNHEFWCKEYDEDFRKLLYYRRIIFDNAENITPIENRLKEVLDKRKIEYSFQYKIGPYVLDFYFERKSKKLNVECDGKEYHFSDIAIKHDQNRNKYMLSNGISVLRFTGSEIWNDAQNCVNIIENFLEGKHTA